MAALARALALILIALPAGPASAAAPAQPAAPDAAPAAPNCREGTSHRQCLRSCTPANLIFLPCMAVGAKAMAACRERELANCSATCRRKFC